MQTQRVHKVILAGAAAVVALFMLNACGPGAPKDEVQQMTTDAATLQRLCPRIIGIQESRTGAIVTWELNRLRNDIIRGYQVYVSPTAGLAMLAPGDKSLADALYNFSVYPGDTDGDIRKETITIDRLQTGTEYFVHVRTAFPGGQSSPPSDEVRIIPRPRGTLALSPRLSGGQEGFSFVADTVVDWNALENDIYIYSVRDTTYLASPSRISGELHESWFVDLGPSQSLDDHPHMPDRNGANKIVLREAHSVGVRLNNGRLAKLRVVDIDETADPLRIAFEYLYQPRADEDTF